MPSEHHERWCRDQFDSWLGIRFPSEPRAWKPGANPPDLILTLCGKDYAVEVSSLVWMEPCGDDDFPTTGVHLSLTSFVNGLEKELKDEGLLRGGFVIAFDVAIPELGRSKGKLESQIRQYISKTIDQAKASEDELMVRGKRVGDICKYAREETKLIVLTPDNRGGWANEVYGQICSALTERIQEKRGKLLKIDKYLPWILLLHDQYFLADESDFHRCLPWIEDAQDFHTIFVVGPAGNGFVLKSRWFPTEGQDCKVGFKTHEDKTGAD